ncbi:MAG: hypothetical protein P4M07_11210 [Xanthobacteraceae bacterium]|nr:hypothetical protein [Xanthobacteraceae bacterium]
MEYRGIRFELDVIGLDTWRWTVHTDTPSGFRLIGQFRGTRDAAIFHCRSVIDGHVKVNDGRGDA